MKLGPLSCCKLFRMNNLELEARVGIGLLLHTGHDRICLGLNDIVGPSFRAFKHLSRPLAQSSPTVNHPSVIARLLKVSLKNPLKVFLALS